MVNILRQRHVSGQGQVKGKKHYFHSLGPRVGYAGREEFRLTQSAVVVCLGKVIFKKIKVNVRSQKVTKNESQACRVAYVFWVTLHLDINSDGL